MHPFLVLIVVIGGALAAAPVHAEGAADSLRVSFAKSSETDLATVMIGDYNASQESNYLISASWGRQYSETLFGLPFPMTANIGLQYLAERGYQEDGLGATAFIKAHYDWKLPFTDKYVRVGLGEGLSYVSRVPMSEQRDFAKKGVESEKLMNYLEWTIDVPLKQFSPAMHINDGGIEDVSIGFIVWHRSSVFGVFADKGGGVNFMGFGFEARY
jgi:hypothetical protein